MKVQDATSEKKQVNGELTGKWKTLAPWVAECKNTTI